jgi:hypothetical protein
MMVTLATGQDFLSNLRNLTIYDWCPRIDSFELLIGALVARRLSSHAQLQSFQGFFLDDSESQPDDGTIAALRQFAEDRMYIHVGPAGQNYICYALERI